MPASHITQIHQIPCDSFRPCRYRSFFRVWLAPLSVWCTEPITPSLAALGFSPRCSSTDSTIDPAAIFRIRPWWLHITLDCKHVIADFISPNTRIRWTRLGRIHSSWCCRISGQSAGLVSWVRKRRNERTLQQRATLQRFQKERFGKYVDSIWTRFQIERYKIYYKEFSKG